MSPKFLSILTILLTALSLVALASCADTSPLTLKRKTIDARNKNRARRVGQNKDIPTSMEEQASPFGQIEKVFVDTLKDGDEDFGRRLPQVAVEPLSFDFLVVEHLVPKYHDGPSKGSRGYSGSKSSKSKGKGRRGYSYSGSKGKGKDKGGKLRGCDDDYTSKGKGKGKGKSGKKSYDRDNGKIHVVEEITYYGSGPAGSKPCIYGDPNHPCAFSGPMDDDLYRQ